MRVLITGGTGFLGHAYANRLLRNGAAGQIRVTGRDAGKVADLVAKGVEFVQGDLTDPAVAVQAAKQADVVIHCAGKSGLGGPPAQYAVNVSGTKNLLAAARDAGAGRFINIGTPSMYFDYTHTLNRDENYLPSKFVDPYSATKAEAESLVMRAHSAHFKMLSLRPRFVTGRGETNIFGRFIAQQKAGRLRRVGSGLNRVDFTSLENMLDAIDLCVAAPDSAYGECYNITNGEPVELWAFLNELMLALGLGSIRGSIPYPVAYAVGAAVEAIAALRGKEPFLSRLGTAVLSKSMTMNIDKARKRLGYVTKQTNAEMLAEFVGWYLNK